VLLLFVSAAIGFAQNKTDDVRLFQTYFQDAPVTGVAIGEGFFQYGTSDYGSAIDIGVQSLIPVGPQFQVGAGVSFESQNPKDQTDFFGNKIELDGESGITDITVAGYYQAMPGVTPISVGALLTLPIGSEDIGEGTFDFTFFGSLRHNTPSGLAITGTLGLEFFEVGDDRETSVLIAGGAIYPLQSGVSLVGELNIKTEGDYMLLSAGADYPLASGGRLRGGIGLGLDDGAPDFLLQAGYTLSFR
jgi:hypothetical protein